MSSICAGMRRASSGHPNKSQRKTRSDEAAQHWRVTSQQLRCAEADDAPKTPDAKRLLSLQRAEMHSGYARHYRLYHLHLLAMIASSPLPILIGKQAGPPLLDFITKAISGLQHS